MRYRIERACSIRFADPVREHHVRIRLAPWADELQSLVSLTLSGTPDIQPVARRDGFGKLSHHFDVLGAHRELRFLLASEVETHLANPFDFVPVDPARERAWIADSLRQAPRLWDFVLHRGPMCNVLEGLAGPRPAWEAGAPLMGQIQAALDWLRDGLAAVEETRAVQDKPGEGGKPDEEGGPVGDGDSRSVDLAHLSLALLRDWGVPARFVHGYLDPAYFDADDEAPEGTAPSPQGLRPWVEALIPGGGWRGFDPSLGLLADATYIRVAVGREWGDVEPLRHTGKGPGGAARIDCTLDVTRLGGPDPA